jgi:hypothetical protein
MATEQRLSLSERFSKAAWRWSVHMAFGVPLAILVWWLRKEPIVYGILAAMFVCTAEAIVLFMWPHSKNRAGHN